MQSALADYVKYKQAAAERLRAERQRLEQARQLGYTYYVKEHEKSLKAKKNDFKKMLEDEVEEQEKTADEKNELKSNEKSTKNKLKEETKGEEEQVYKRERRTGAASLTLSFDEMMDDNYDSDDYSSDGGFSDGDWDSPSSQFDDFDDELMFHLEL